MIGSPFGLKIISELSIDGFLFIMFFPKQFVFSKVAPSNTLFSIFSLTLDKFFLFFEFIFGYNVLGFKSYMPGRLSGFFNQELKIGYLYSSICLVILSYFVLDIKKINLSLI